MYGWTDDQILDQVELFGMSWLLESWKYVQEDKIDKYRTLMLLMPLARTPQDSKGASAMRSYAKSLERNFDQAVPWRKASGSVRESLRGKVKPGEVVVILEEGEAGDDQLYEAANVTRE